MSTHRAVEMFERVVLAVIVANTAVLVWGLLDHVRGDLIDTLHESFLLFFVAELAVRFAAAGFNPRRFFGSGWNSFDAVVVAVGVAADGRCRGDGAAGGACSAVGPRRTACQRVAAGGSVSAGGRALFQQPPPEGGARI